MTPVELSRSVLHAVRCAVDDGQLSVVVPSRVVVGRPGPGGCGDYATNVALQLARPAGQPPLRVAALLRGYLAREAGVTDVEITGPGFLNITLDRAATSTALVRRILREGLRYGHTGTVAGQVFVLCVPYEVRAEVLADVLARMVGSQGGRVEVEHGGVEHGGVVNLRPAAAPEDPAFLGPDAARWALLHPAPHDRPRITADHLVQRESNPLFRIRYAHARTRAVSRNAADLGFTTTGPETDVEAADTPDITNTPDTPEAPDAPDTPGAPQLLALLADHPRVLATAVALPHADAQAAPSRLTRHLLALADATLVLLPAVLPRGDEKPSAAHRSRLALAEAAGTVLAGGLSLLGIDAPDHL
ncbi:DALR anticodon-binding domain-containing protein [Streptomyces sp. ID05-39B]|uniref:ArgS-related anticodon-binding protein NrtL n=1 Tax=Streptomyces sp. ID05-39B TaxID=3028664 RepID=UPI0029BE4735|nr:DALR anticodon-binding domain-containing protein [Streptomyces sp. ID05-39B]MDX3528450.1 DALR anticodon-binding domain-containing protein [Streptomyces sp. ID05-39B]